MEKIRKKLTKDERNRRIKRRNCKDESRHRILMNNSIEVMPTEIVRKYLHWKIDRMKPLCIDFVISNYAKTGMIYEGRNAKDLPSFEGWQKRHLIEVIDQSI